MKNTEEWLDAPFEECSYQVSNHGGIRHVYPAKKYVRDETVYKEITPQLKKPKGYLRVFFRVAGKRKYFYVHRLVALAFIPVVEGKMDVNHKDGIKTNNYYENLEWCTPVENNLHAHRVLGVTVIKPVTLVNRKDRAVFGKFPSELNARKSLGGLKGFLIVPTNLYSKKYVNSILDKPRKKREYVPRRVRKLNEEQVREIMRLVRSGMRDYHVALRVGCKGPTVRGIRMRKIYRDIIIPRLVFP